MKCKIKTCRKEFVRRSIMHKLCGSPECAVEWARLEKEKKERAAQRLRNRETAEQREKQMTLNDHLKLTERVVNRYVLVRDADEPCISCGTRADVQYAAGHYRTVKAAGHLRFCPAQIHKQCNRHCNSGLSGNIYEYRPALIARIGLERFEAIENNNTPRRWTIEEAKEIRAYFAEETRKILRERPFKQRKYPGIEW